MPTSLYITALNRPNRLDYQRSSNSQHPTSIRHRGAAVDTCYDMLHIITLLILLKGYSTLQVKNTVGILLYTNMLSR